MSIRRFLPFLLALVVLGVVWIWVQPEAPAPVEGVYDWSRVDRALEGMVSEYDISGASMLVMRHGEVLYDRSIGDFDGNSTVTAGSASKWASAAAILTLVDDGTLTLEQPLSSVIPAFDNPKTADLSLRDALAHKTGLPAKHPCLREYDIPLRKCVGQIGRTTPAFPPGRAFGYGALSYHAAAGMAEAVADKPWREVFRERITGPLGMKRTDYGRFGASPNPGIAGNLNTSRDDFARFLQMVYDGGVFEGERILSEDSVAEMLAGQTEGAPRVMHVPFRHGGTNHDLYGLGVWRDIVDPQGRLLVGSSPGKFGFVPWIDWRYGIVGVLSAEFSQETLDEGLKPPDPAIVVAMVCSVVDAYEFGPRDEKGGNPRCRLIGVQRPVPGQGVFRPPS